MIEKNAVVKSRSDADFLFAAAFFSLILLQVVEIAILWYAIKGYTRRLSGFRTCKTEDGI
ncbi:hypothetical protein [Lacrimispora sp.]|uniref:hypothetical protein n=1 Tax=Lacrimispora sp. TaxID=2719234 RepID=UPI0039E3D648